MVVLCAKVCQDTEPSLHPVKEYTLHGMNPAFTKCVSLTRVYLYVFSYDAPCRAEPHGVMQYFLQAFCAEQS